MKEPTRAEWIADIKAIYGIDYDALSKEEKIQFFRDMDEQMAQEKADYLARLKTPNRDSIKKLHRKDTSSPEFLADILDCLRDETDANSFEGMEIARPEQFIDPVAEGYVSKNELEIFRYMMNARGIWANLLTGKLTFLFGLSKKAEHENLRYALSVGVELMQFARDNPNGELANMLNQLSDKITKGHDEMPRRVAREVKKNAATRPTAGKPPRYTEKKMGQAFERMHKLINNSGKTQLKAAAETIKRMKLDIGARYLTEAYREWLPTRPQGKKT